jgi:sodium-dependent dicarboxylate transporter 2/3/5
MLNEPSLTSMSPPFDALTRTRQFWEISCLLDQKPAEAEGELCYSARIVSPGESAVSHVQPDGSVNAGADTGGRFERIRRTVGLFLGLALFAGVLLLPVPDAFIALAHDALGPAAPLPDVTELAAGTRAALALALLMVIWWLTEAVPLPVTALLPGVVLPVLHVCGSEGGKLYLFTPKTAFANYASPVIFLFLGGFLIAGAMGKWGLDRRFTLWILTRGNLANHSGGILLGVMAATAFLSMWVSNTATAAMMLPLAMGILARAGISPGRSPYGTSLMLGVAWAASIGGVGTLIGTPPNGIAISILAGAGIPHPDFLGWMKIGVPFVILTIPLAWLILRLLFPPEIKSIPGGKEALQAERRELGRWSAGEKATLSVFLLAVILWVSNPFLGYFLPGATVRRLTGLDEYTIALLAALLLFAIPVNWRRREFALDWSDSKAVDWGTLLLFGGGIALSEAIFRTGLAGWIASTFIGLVGHPSTLLLTFMIVILMDFLTEVTSNTAVTSMMVPVIIVIARGSGADPATLSVAAAVAASMAFMLPVATPPNALVYGTGRVAITDMIKAGFVLDIAGWCLTVGILYIFGDLIFGVLKF